MDEISNELIVHIFSFLGTDVIITSLICLTWRTLVREHFTSETFMEYIIKHRNVLLFRWAMNIYQLKRSPKVEQYVKLTCQVGCVDIFAWFHKNRYCTETGNLVEYMVHTKDLSLLLWAIDHNYVVDDNVVDTAVEHGNVTAIQYLWKEFEFYCDKNLKSWARRSIENNHMNMFKFLVRKAEETHNTLSVVSLYGAAIQSENKEVIKWLCSRGKRTPLAYYAALDTNVNTRGKMIKFLYEHSIPFPKDICQSIIKTSATELLPWACEHGAQWNGREPTTAIKCGDVVALEYLKQNGFRPDKFSLILAQQKTNNPATEWIQSLLSNTPSSKDQSD